MVGGHGGYEVCAFIVQTLGQLAHTSQDITTQKCTEDEADAHTMTDRHVFNDHTTLVLRSLKGLVASHPYLSLIPSLKVVYRADHDKSKVSLICGGGSGHEPGTVGFVSSIRTIIGLGPGNRCGADAPGGAGPLVRQCRRRRLRQSECKAGLWRDQGGAERCGHDPDHHKL